MTKRQRKKILKRCGIKILKKMNLSTLEKKAMDRAVESKFTSALDKFRDEEFKADTIYDNGYIRRLTKLHQETLTIGNVTGVKEVLK